MKRVLILCLLAAAWVARAEDGWVSLFNGKDLDGWTPKLTGHELGQDPYNTFRVEEGILKVSFEKYLEFGGQFGHLFYKRPFTNYLLRLEYRFTGDQVKGGPGWAFRNSGIMAHGQPAETMAKGQNFPVSLEVQLLGGSGKGPRSTGNLCSPGTHVTMDGKLVKTHCINSSSKTYDGDQWVKAEFESRDGVCIHRINGEEVIRYSDPVLDEGDGDAKKLIAAGMPIHVRSGTISLQSESHPCEFRHIEVKELP